MNPYVSLELFDMEIRMEQPSGKAQEELTRDKSVDLVKESNNFAFDPMMIRVLVSAIVYDWVSRTIVFLMTNSRPLIWYTKFTKTPILPCICKQNKWSFFHSVLS